MLIADGGGGGGAAFDAIGQSMDMFAGAAASGGFAINETGGKALLQAIQGMKDWVDTNQLDLQNLGQEPQLGGTNAAIAMKPYIAQVATDGQGFLTMLMKFRESLDKAEQGIKDAMKNYQATDQSGQARLNK
jgi:hypothetical protein